MPKKTPKRVPAKKTVRRASTLDKLHAGLKKKRAKERARGVDSRPYKKLPKV